MLRRIAVITLLLLAGLVSASQARRIRVPQDYTTIQQAINAAVNGDTVLVAEGTYKVNLYIGKRIVLGSLFLTDADTSHTSRTILDGSLPTHPDSGSTVTFGPGTDTSSAIIGFTITGGKGNRHLAYDTNPPWPFVAGGGIDIYRGGASVLHNIIRQNALTSATDSATGGGLCAATWSLTEQTSHVIIEDNTILQNSSTSSGAASGGGITIWGTSGRVMRNRVINNSTKYGGGITVWAMASWGIDSLTISENVVQGNYASVNIGGIDASGNGLVASFRNNVVIDNAVGNAINGMALGSNMYALVEGNYVARNTGSGTGGIYLYSINTNSIVRNNIITGNAGDGIRARYTTTAILINNTIVGNTGAGINAYSPAALRGLNNVIWGNGGASISGTGFIFLDYSLVQGGFAGTGNITSDPLFISTHADSIGWFRSNSPAANAGAAQATVGGILLTAPAQDYYGHNRFGPKPDIGAFEDGPWSAVEDGESAIPSVCELEQNYPNPFNPATNFEFRIADFGLVKLAIYDMVGREVAVLVNEEKPAGTYWVSWDATNLPSGVYFYQLRAEGPSTSSGQVFVETRKCLLLR